MTPDETTIGFARERLDDFLIDRESREIDAFWENQYSENHDEEMGYHMTNQELIDELQKLPKDAKVDIAVLVNINGMPLTAYDRIAGISLTEQTIHLQTHSWLEHQYEKKQKARLFENE